MSTRSPTGIHRIATFVPEDGLTFNQFLLTGDEPLLFHTGARALFRETLDGISRIMDPTRLRWVSWSHFEADECGALNDFLELAPAAEPLHSELGAKVAVQRLGGRRQLEEVVERTALVCLEVRPRHPAQPGGIP